jgi:hypothetical protein
MSAVGPARLFREFRLPRRGHGAAECEDAAAGDPQLGRFAVADGVSESAHAGLWARLLVEDFVRAPEVAPGRTLESIGWASWLAPLQRRWADEVQRSQNGLVLPWYLEDPLRQGAFATFLGVVIGHGGAAPGRRDWQAFAVGDSCVFQTRQGELLRSFPLTRSADFSSTPWLVGSRTPPGGVPQQHGLELRGNGHEGDRLWLMTDALAQWFLLQAEADRRPWEPLEHSLLAPDPDTFFARWIEELRTTQQLRNDDVTLMAVFL